MANYHSTWSLLEHHDKLGGWTVDCKSGALWYWLVGLGCFCTHTEEQGDSHTGG